MRVRTELSETPPQYTIEQENEMAVITFYTDVEQYDNGETEAYRATAWIVKRPYAQNLQERISGNYQTWLLAAKEECYTYAAVEVRGKRDAMLAESDWTQVQDTALTENQIAEYRAYRQALRDVPEQAGFPYDVEWPEIRI